MKRLIYAFWLLVATVATAWADKNGNLHYNTPPTEREKPDPNSFGALHGFETDFGGKEPDELLSDMGKGVLLDAAMLPLGIEREGANLLGAGGKVAKCENIAAVGKPSLSAYKKALKEVQDKVGKLPKGKPGKFGSPQGGDAIKGYRLDPPHPGVPAGSPESQYHINWWDWTEGKKGTGGRYGAIPVTE